MIPDFWYRWLAGGVLVASVGVWSAYGARAELRGGVAPAWSPGDLQPAMRALTGVVMWASLMATLIMPNLVAWARVPLPPLARLAGAVLGVVGVPAIWWTFQSLGTNVSQTTGTRAGAELVTHGPYRWVRHPLYTTGLNLYLALGLMLESGLLLGLFVLAALWIPRRVAREEEYLISSYGDRYRDYQRTSGRFLPRIGRR